MDDLEREPKFLPVMKINEPFYLENINTEGYFIMPSTYKVKT